LYRITWMTKLCLAVLLAAVSLAGAESRTLRLDYFHTGDASGESFSLDGLVLEGSWPGNPAHPLDDTNLGKYFFEVRDRSTNRALYSRGFASIYGEWESTPEAKLEKRTFQESLRFPLPSSPVQVVLKKRDRQNAFREVWSVVIDPNEPAIDRASPPRNVHVWPVLKNGEPKDKLDLLLIGDGYTATEMEKWHKDARRMTDLLFAASPFKERKSDFNVWAIDVASEESGVARPSDGVYRRSAVRANYDAFG
jgi:hypothetical protein